MVSKRVFDTVVELTILLIPCSSITEFFKLATDSIFDPQYGSTLLYELHGISFFRKIGMFRMNPDSRLCWFTVDPSRDVETVKEYRLLGRMFLISIFYRALTVQGILIGLAIYNGVVLDIKFPLVLYKLLAGQPPSMSDLLELDPVI